MKLTIREALNVLGGLQALDGYQRVVKDGDKEKVIVESYKLGAGVRFVLAKNIVKLQALNEAHNTARNALIKEFAAGGGDRVPDDKVSEFSTRYRELLDMPEDVALDTLQRNDLALDTNATMPASVIALLMPLISDNA